MTKQLTALILFLFISCYIQAQGLIFSDDFEGTSIDTITNWGIQEINPLGVTISSTQAVSGSKSAKFSFNFSDWTADTAFQPQGRRVEIHGKSVSVPPGTFNLDSTYWTGFSCFFPSSWSTDPTDGIIWQFHGKGGGKDGLIGAGNGNSPPLFANVRPNQDSISVFVNYDSTSPSLDGHMKICQIPLVRGVWTNWVIQYKFDYTNGFVNVWVNGVKKATYTGGTIYHSQGQQAEIGPTLKMGIYKGSWGDAGVTGQASNLTLYWDNVKIGNINSSYAAVSAQAQAYINQSPITINGIVCLLHYNGDASVKHPLIMMFQGAGQYGADPTKALVHGTGWAIQNGKWNPDSVFNFKTNQYESYIVLSTLNVAQNQTPSDAQIEGLYTYMRNNYPVDSNCMVITGLSAGGAPATDFGAHVSGSNCCPPTYTFTTRKNILCAEIPMSPEILDSAAGVTQPVQFEVADSIPVWGWADSNDCQGHGLPLKHWVAHVNRLAPSLGSLFTQFHNNQQCHGGWDSIYTATTRQTIDGHSMNIYEWALYHRRGAPVTPPTQTITIGSIAQSSFCVTPTATASFSVTFTTTGTFNAGNTFNVQMSDATGSFASFINVGTGTSPISCIIPANTTTGANYKFRIQSTNPIVASAASPIKAINLAANKIVPTGNQTVNINVAGTTLTVRDSSVATSHQWYNNSVAIAGQTGTTYIPLFASVSIDTITCKSVFPCATRASNKVIINVVSPSSSLVIPTKNTACGIHNFSSANPGDTILLDSSLLDTLCELTFIHLNGTAAKPITIINKGLILSTAALTFVDDCHWVNANFGTNVNAPHATGSVSLGQFGSKAYDIPYGVKVFGAVVPGGAVEIHGKDSNITVSNVYEPNRGAIGGAAGYGIVMKNDPAAFGCDLTYDYPNTFANITFHDMVFQNINKDVIYLGYSGGYNTNGQSVTCNGVVIYPRPAIIAGLTMYNIYCNTAQRTFIQGGGLSGGNNVFHDMYADNLGGDSLNGVIDGSQGAFAAFGIPDSSVTLYNCGGSKTWLHNIYSYHYGTANFFNNTFDSAGYLTVHGVLQVNPSQSSIAFFPKANIYNVPTQIILQNNTLGKNSANFNVRLDFGNNPYATTGNIICNSGNVYNPVPVNYSTCAPLNTITTNTPAVTTYCVTQSVGANITVTGTSTGTFNSNNVYTAYLSDATGNFATSTLLGSVASTSNSFSISGAVPANMPTGSGYRIRVLSSNPVVTGTQNLTNITINLAANSVTPSATQNLFVNANGNLLTVSETSTANGLWYVNNVSTGISIKTYTPNFATAGTRTITYKSTFSCGVITSNAVTVIVTNPPTPKITTGLISGSPFCVTATLGANLSVLFTSVGTYPAGNQYIVQLSGRNGSFASPTTIGTLTSTANSGTISANIPANSPTGIAYKVRVISTTPAITGSASATFSVNLATNRIAPTGTQNIFINTAGNLLTVTEQSASTSRVWLVNGVSSGISTTTYTPNFATAGVYHITCQSVLCATVTSNSITINVTNPPPPPPDSVFTGTISGSPFSVTTGATASVSVPFTSNRTSFASDNVFTAQLSDASGSFATATSIGTLPSTAASGTISGNIPANTPTGRGYKIRVISSNPIATGIVSSTNLTVNLESNSIAPTATQNIFTNIDGDVLTVSETSTATSRLWFVNGVSSGITATTYTPNFASAGTYVIDCRSVFTSGTITSNTVTVIVSVPPAPTVSTGIITGSPFCITATAGASVSVPYTISGTFNAGNVFTAQLSDAAGSFNSFTNIGNVTSTTSGTISATIPANTPTGTQYNIRVVSSNPSITGSDNGGNIVVNLASVNVTPSATQNILINTNGIALTANEGSTPISRVWLYGNVSGTYPTNTGNTTATYTPNFSAAGSYYVVDVSTFACETDTSNAVLINATIPNPPSPDTTCTTYQIQHDTAVIKSFQRITPYDSIISVTQPFYFYILRIKIRIPGIIVTSSDTLHLKDTTYFDSVITITTPLHDTTICVPSYRMGINYFSSPPISIALQIDTAKYVGVNYIRFNITRGASNWNVQQANDSGMHVLQTINNSPAGSSGFAAYVTSQYNKGKPELSTGQNEPTINDASQADNLTDLQTLIDVSHPLGIKVADGGITSDVAYYIVDYWNTHGKSDSATWLRTTLGLNMSSAAAIKAIGQYDTLFAAYRTMNLDYVNVHFYEPLASNPSAIYPTGLLPIFLNFIATQTGKPLMSNEYGTRNASCNLLTQLTLQGLNSGLQYMIYFDGNASGGAIKNQDCFKQIISNLK